MQEKIKTVIFYGVFALVFILYALIVGAPLIGFAELGGATMALIASMTPIILNSLSLPGELTPAVLGGLMAYTAPSRTSWGQTLLLVFLSGLGWLLYLHLQVYFGSEATTTALQIVDVPADKLADAVSALQSFSNSVRSFAAVIFAAILGLRFNDNAGVIKGDSAGEVALGPDPAAANPPTPADP